MSPIGQSRGKKMDGAPDNIYTVILVVAFGVVVTTAAFVAYQCYTQYGAIFTLP